MQKIPVEQLLKELQEIDNRVVIKENQNRPGLSNIMINGMDICVIPSIELQTEHSNDYVYRFPNDMVIPLRTYDEAKGVAETILTKLKDPKFSEDFFDTSYAE